MKTLVRLVAVLGLTAAVSAIALAKAYAWAAPQIERHRQAALEAAIYSVLPDVDTYRDTLVDGRPVFAGYRGSDLAGYAVPASGNGFQGKIGLMFGLTPGKDATTGLTVLETVETPGLGDKITLAPFLDQFAGLGLAEGVSYVKNRPPDRPLEVGQIDAITGATISSAAVVSIINAAIAGPSGDGGGN